MNIKRFLIFLSVALAMLTTYSCKTKTVTTENGTVKILSPKKIVKESNSKYITPKYLSSSLKIKYKSKNKKVSFNANLRMENDKTIWMNISFLGISFARAIITPDGVKMYERKNRTKFSGDFSYLSKLLGVELDFNQLQSLFLGKPIQNIEPRKYSTMVSKNSYLLEYKNNKRLVKKGDDNNDYIKRFWYNTQNFELERQLVSLPNRKKTLMVDNKNYEMVKGKYLLPKNINLQIIDGSVTLVEIEYRGIKVDKKLSFPFRIPEGYKEIQIK